MDDLFRLSAGKPHDPAIDAWLDRQRPGLGGIARRWFEKFRASGCGDVRELMHDGAPTACVEDVALGYVNVFRAHVNVGFTTAPNCLTARNSSKVVDARCAMSNSVRERKSTRRHSKP